LPRRGGTGFDRIIPLELNISGVFCGRRPVRVHEGEILCSCLKYSVLLVEAMCKPYGYSWCYKEDLYYIDPNQPISPQKPPMAYDTELVEVENLSSEDIIIV